LSDPPPDKLTNCLPPANVVKPICVVVVGIVAGPESRIFETIALFIAAWSLPNSCRNFRCLSQY